MLSVFFPKLSGANSPEICQGDNRKPTTCTERNGITLSPVRRACVPHCAELLCCVAGCAYRSLRSVIHHLYIFAAALCATDLQYAHSGQKLRTIGLNISASTAIMFPTFCVFTRGSPTKSKTADNIRKKNNVANPPGSTSSSGMNHARVAGPWCTEMDSCLSGGCGSSSVITIFCCAAVYVCVP